MGFNYSQEKRKFDRTWERLERDYKSAGMSEDAISVLKSYDWTCFCSERRYRRHTATLSADEALESYSGNQTQTVTLDFDAFECTERNRYEWLSTIENQDLYKKLCELPKRDLELLTLLVIDGYHQSEIARKIGCSRNAIYKRLKKIKKFLIDG